MYLLTFNPVGTRTPKYPRSGARGLNRRHLIYTYLPRYIYTRTQSGEWTAILVKPHGGAADPTPREELVIHTGRVGWGTTEKKSRLMTRALETDRPPPGLPRVHAVEARRLRVPRYLP